MRKSLRFAVAAMALSLVAIATPAGAVTGSPPTPADDQVTVREGDFKAVNLLANDTDPDGDTLEICRFGTLPDALFVEQDGDQTYIGAERAGTFTFTYYACDLSYLSPATVTVTVQKPPPMFIHVHKSIHVGKIRVSNRGSYRFQFAYGSYKAKRADGMFYLRPHTSRLVAVQRHSLIWFAYNGHKQTFRLGILRGIQLPAGVTALSDGAPPKDGGFFRTAGRTGVRWSR